MSTRTPGKTGGPATSAYREVDVQVQHRVEQFLFAEAQLLDDNLFLEWLDLFSEDILYWIPTRMTRPVRERHLQVAALGESALVEDDMASLRGRVLRLTSGMAWSEEPPSRTRRLLTNIRVTPRDDGSLDVTSNFYVYRSRLEVHQDWFVGERYDVLRPADRSVTGYPFTIAYRKIVMEQTTLLSPSLSIFL
ncbi:benzene 1,2-dioxygenase [Rhodococcus sp. 05-340-1]|uniref:aromatic-ring-hydroxylating dioxygenase subunit beta n=1 Tax=unclassified Rhodococcus (in: high G+C Gram-positive bacteria) TaxID=192944 RepID=UPI000B9AFF5E|nr:MULTISPECIES: aromatic-ring-hydroxylating dioxygenase subunit beta [unclassified Rhodococcus (in: high G+C Gram-positive bacteria)]OZD68865.1 benzene 1,2-dioxygenase [Rhodococcus sp. 05-340-2]OZD69338.1 benzene 1,2-dioxygenase [Rhodococcus sp. 05-340-1]